MISLESLEIYNRYERNGDLFVRFGSEEEKDILDYDSWVLIEEFIRDIHLMQLVVVSNEFEDFFQNKLVENCDSPEVILHLK